jgi:hypothetical protein
LGETLQESRTRTRVMVATCDVSPAPFGVAGKKKRG